MITPDQSRAYLEAKGRLLGEDPDDGTCDYDDVDDYEDTDRDRIDDR